MVDDTQNRKDLEILQSFLIAQCKEITEKSSIGDKLLKGVLTSTLIDLHSAILLLNGGMPMLSVNQQSWDDYIKHLKRSFVQESWSAVESRIRDVAAERSITFRGRSAVIRGYVEEALKEAPPESLVAKALKKAQKMLSGDFVEFPTVQHAVISSIEGIDRHDWAVFLDMFRIMRNSAHDNFRAGQTGKFTCSFLSKEFVRVKSSTSICWRFVPSLSELEASLLQSNAEKAQQGARANDHGRHAACYRSSFEMKLQNSNRHAARGAPAMVVAHL